MQILNKCFLIINCHYIKILLWPLCTVISAVDIDEVDNPDTFRYTDHCLSCRGTPKNGAWFNIYSVTYTFLLLSLLYGWWLNFYGIFFLLWLAWNEYFFLAFNIFGTSPVEYIVDLTVFDGFSLDAWGSQSPASFYIYILGPPLINCSFALSQQKLLKPWFTI